MMPWKAAQFAAAHQWMLVGDKGFHAQETLTRGESATILDRVFHLSPAASSFAKAKFAHASYSDVPLYSPLAMAVEEWKKQAQIPVCSSDAGLFCAHEKMRTGEFVDAVAAMNAARQHRVAREFLRRNVMAADADPLTRGDAAMILFNNAQAK